MISKFGTWLFQSTPSARRATPITKPCSSKDFVFQSTPSARRATRELATSIIKSIKFQSTPSARRATKMASKYFDNKEISIHALREEGDSKFTVVCPRQKNISIHALREEGDWF